MGGSGIRKVECAGPVTVAQKDQVATGDNAVFDQEAKRIVLTGNVVLSQCQNVTRGSRLVYDMATGRANMDPVAGGRVSAMFVPGERTGQFRLGTDTLLSNEQGSSISYEDYAIALADEIAQPRHIRQRFTVGY